LFVELWRGPVSRKKKRGRRRNTTSSIPRTTDFCVLEMRKKGGEPVGLGEIGKSQKGEESRSMMAIFGRGKEGSRNVHEHIDLKRRTKESRK